MKKLLGCGAAPGCARGKAACLQLGSLSVERCVIEDAEQELGKLETARDAYFAALQELINREDQLEDAAAILESYVDILEDESFFSCVQERVKQELVNVDYALKAEKEAVMEQFAALDDAYLMERATDVANVCNELIRRIQGNKCSCSLNVTSGNEKVIVFAEDLTPDQTLQMDRSMIAGFVTEKGGLTSHTVILAKTLGIPAIGVSWGYGDVAQMEQAGAIAIANTTDELLSTLEGSI